MNAPAAAIRLGLLLLAFAIAPAVATPSLPEATPDLASTGLNQSVLIDVLGNDVELGAGLRLLNVHKPSQGKTQVENGRVRYTPRAGFQGSDQFYYMVQAPKSQPRVGTVTVEVGGGGVMLRLSGQVVDSPVPGAVVRVSVGGFDFVAVADASGNYVLDIAALSGNAFVTITATGTSATGAPVDFVSLVGEIARLNGDAGTDGVLTLDENNQVNVTHLSTAQFVLLADANGGLPPEDDAELLQLTQSIDIDQLIELAAIIKLVVDGGEPLPAGVDSVLELISDDAALAVFVDALDPGQLDDAIADIGAGTEDLTGFSPSRVPGGYAVILPGDTGTIRVGIGGQFLLRFDGVALGTGSGTGQHIGAVFRSNPGTTWQVVGNQLAVTFDETEVQSFPNGSDCNRIITVTGVMLTRLQDGAGVDYLEVQQNGTDALVESFPGSGCAVQPPIALASFRGLGFEEGQAELPFGASETLGTMMLPYFRPSIYPAGGSTGWGAALFDFATAQVAIPGVNPGFGWSVTGGRLHLDLTDPVDGVQQYEFRRYQQDGRKGEGVMAVVTRPDGARAAIYALSARVDGSLPAFTEAMLPGRWRSGFDVSQFQPDLASDFGFFLRMYDNPARTGEFESVTYLPDGTPNVSLFPPMTWGVGTGDDAGKMVALTFRTGPGFGGTFLAWCDVLVDVGCNVVRRRTWTPVAMDGDRVYVLERLIFRVGGSFGLVPQLVGERPNFYDLGPLP